MPGSIRRDGGKKNPKSHRNHPAFKMEWFQRGFKFSKPRPWWGTVSLCLWLTWLTRPSVRGVDDLLLPDWTPPLHSNSVTELTCYTNKKQHKKKKICLDWKQWKLNWLVFSFKGAPQNQSSENVFASQINPATQLVSASAPRESIVPHIWPVISRHVPTCMDYTGSQASPFRANSGSRTQSSHTE